MAVEEMTVVKSCMVDMKLRTGSKTRISSFDDRDAKAAQAA